MRVLVVILLTAVLLFALTAPAVAQENQVQAGQAAQGTQDQGRAERVAGPLNRLVEKVEALAVPVVALGILIGALALMVAPKIGKSMLGFILLAGLLLLGGWRWLLDLIRYILAP